MIDFMNSNWSNIQHAYLSMHFCVAGYAVATFTISIKL